MLKRMVTNLGLLQIFFSLLLVISIMFVSTYLVYRNSISGIYEKVSENNTLVVKSVVQSFDNSFRTIDNIIHAIHNLPPYDNFGADEIGRLDMSKVYTLVDNLGTLISTNNYIEEVIISYVEADLAITSRGTSSFSLYFNNQYKHELYNANYWRSFLMTKHNFKLFPEADFNLLTATGQQQRTKKLMVAVGGNKIQMSKKNVMMLIGVEDLLKHVNQKTMIPGASLIVLDQDRNIILSTDKDLDLVEVLNDVYFSSDQEATITRENYEYNFYKSDYNGFIYIDKVPYQFQNLDSVAEANNMIMISAILCALVLSVFLSLYLNRPVKNILRLLGGGNSIGNDFRKIYSGIVKIQSENVLYKKQIEYVDIEIRRGVFLQALDEYSHTKEHELQMQKYYPDFFQEKNFVIAILQFNPKENDKRFVLSVDIMSDSIESGLRREDVKANVFHVANSQFIVVIGLNHPNERDKLLKSINSFIVRSEKEEFMEFILWACVSKLYTSKIDNCKRAYQDVINGSLYRNVNDTNRVMDADEIRYVWTVHFPFEKMEKLSNYLLSSKQLEGIQIIKEVMKENKDRNIHHHQFIHIAKTMFFYMLRHAGGSANTHNELYELERNFCRRVEYALDYEEVENALIEVARFLASLENREQKSKLNPAFVSQYIELHYMENMYLDHIAEVMETSPKYFSNYFKKTFGVNYVEHLNKVRLSHARELLKDKSLSIAEVGEKTGYLNSSTFTTTFRKYLGVSPSDYRKQNDS